MNTLVLAFDAGASLTVEVAWNAMAITHGLSRRAFLPEERGMLFRMGWAGDHRFWMRDTAIPLDLVFANEQGQIVGIVTDTVPFTDDLHGVDHDSFFVLEVNAGWCARHGVKVGQTLKVAR